MELGKVEYVGSDEANDGPIWKLKENPGESSTSS